MEWFAVRSVFKFGEKADGTNIFEERIVGFCAADADEALHKAETESQQYAQSRRFEVAAEMMAYQQDGDALIDGYELYSQLFQSKESLQEFYQNRYGRYRYVPEDPAFRTKPIVG